MKKGFLKKILTTILTVLLMVMVCYGISWIVTCGIFALICWCFGMEFSWLAATGMWLVYILLKNIFSHHTTINNK